MEQLSLGVGLFVFICELWDVQLRTSETGSGPISKKSTTTTSIVDKKKDGRGRPRKDGKLYSSPALPSTPVSTTVCCLFLTYYIPSIYNPFLFLP